MAISLEKPHMRPLLGVADVAEILGISPASIYKRRSIGEPMPPAVRIGSALRWRPADIERFLEEHLEPPLNAQAAPLPGVTTPSTLLPE